ncbi:MAG: nucleotidyltransferase family protein [Erysipelotrichaceae bacterium]|nr:nucleotidyltransferase family protein [Erysipelotrichaceae bacterium]
MNDFLELFYSLIRVSLDIDNTLSRCPTTEEWRYLFRLSSEQAIQGVCFAGIQHLVQDNSDDVKNLPKELKMNWIASATMITNRNEVLDHESSYVIEKLNSDGFPAHILKGQSMNILYGNLKGLRQSGDIDVWVPCTRTKLFQYSIKKYGCISGLTYHHIHLPMIADAEVEAHTWPSFLSSPIRNRNFHSFCNSFPLNSISEQENSLAFNRVFILLHCYQHFVRRGVGLRQFVDYYFVLLESSRIANNIYWKEDTLRWLQKLGLLRFTSATMWIMKYIFKAERILLCEPNEEYGRILLNEILATGNMGHSDRRVNRKQQLTPLGRFISNFKRDLSIMKVCPEELFWEPIWGIYQFIWCKYILRKYNRV